MMFGTLLLKFAPILSKNAATAALHFAPHTEVIDYLREHAPEAVQGVVTRLAKINPLEQAIQATCELPSFPVDLADALRSWLQAESFQSLLASLQTGDLPPDDRILAELAGALSPFLASLSPDRTQSIAVRAVEVFIRNLDRFVVLGDVGLSTHDRREQKRHELTRDVIRTEIQNLRASPTPMVGDVGPLPESELKFSVRLDEVRALLRSGHIRAARARLDEIEKELDPATASREIQYRLEANQGICSLFLEESDPAAAERFERARKHQPENPTGYANCARIALVRGDAARALVLSEEALYRDENHSYARALQVQSLFALGESKKLNDLYAAEQVQTDPIVLMAFAGNAFECEDYEQAETLARRATELDESDGYAWELLGRAIAVPIQRKLNAGQPLPWMIEATDLTRLGEAQAAFTRALDKFQGTDWTDALATTLANRASTLALTGNLEASLRDCDEALSYKDVEMALTTRATILLQKGRFQDAASAYEDLRHGVSPEPRIDLPLALCYLNEGRVQKAVSILESLGSTVDEIGTRVRIDEVLIEAYFKSGDKEAARRLLTDRQHTLPEAEFIELRSRFYQLTGDAEREIADLLQVQHRAEGARKQKVTLELANAYFLSGSFRQAATEFAKVVNENADNSARSRYLACLFNSGDYKTVLEKVRQVRVSEGIHPIATMIEARILDAIGEVQESASLYEALLPLMSDEPEVHIRLALALERGGREGDAIEAIRAIKLDNRKLEPAESMAIAKLRHRFGMESVLAFALQAAEKARDQPQIQLDYLWIVICRQEIDKPLLEPTEASPGCVLELCDESGRVRFVTIVAETEEQNPPDVVRSSSALGSRLIGLKKGDTVQLGSTQHRVCDVKSRYIHFHQRVYLDFETAFPEHGGLQPVKGDEPLPAIVQSLQAHSASVEKLLTRYRHGEISVGRLATALNRSVPEVMLALMEAENEYVLVSESDPLEIEHGTLALAGKSRIVLELSAMATLGFLHLLPQLSEAFDEIVVAQQTYDDVLEARNRLEFGPPHQRDIGLGPHGILIPGLANGSDPRLLLKEIEEFILQKCCVHGVRSIIEIPALDFARYSDAVTSAALASMLLAHELQLPICADDLVWRRTCALQTVPSLWTGQVLNVLHRRRLLAEDDYYTAQEGLAAARYRAMTVKADLLRWRLQKESFRPTQTAMASLKLLNASRMPLPEALIVAADLLWALGAANVPATERGLLFDAVIGALSTGRSGSSVRFLLRARIAKRWPANAHYTAEVLSSLDMWEMILGNKRSLI